MNIKNVSHKKTWKPGIVQGHVYTPPITLIKSKNDDKLNKHFVSIKLRTDPTLEKSELYEFKMFVFDNSDTDDLLLFICNFNRTLEASGTLNFGTNIQYICMMVRVKGFA